MAVVITPRTEEVIDGALGTLSVGCSVTDLVGDIVYQASAGTVAKADITDPLKLPAIGVITEKHTPTTCAVRMLGIFEGYTGLVPGRLYSVGLDSRPLLGRSTPGFGQSLYTQ
jgi:hypothetical protein